MKPGEKSIGVTFRIRPLTRNIRGGDEGEHSHEGEFDVWILSMDVEARLGLLSWLEMFTTLPIQHKRLSSLDEGHSDESLTGISDLQLGVRTKAYQGEKFRSNITAGITLPTGKRNPVSLRNFLSHEESEALGLVEEPLPELQLGSGAVAGFVGIDFHYVVNERLSLSASALANVSPFENGDGYSLGNTYTFTAGPIYNFGDGKVAGILINLFKSEADSFDGDDIVSDDIRISGSIPDLGNGRFEAALRPYFSWPLGEKLSGYAELNIPFHTEIDTGDRPAENLLREPVGIFFGIRTRF